MKVILRQDIKNLGREWDVVSVADGYARNYLIPRKLAMPATQAGVKDLERRQSVVAERRAREEASARELANRIGTVPVVITARCGPEGRLYGSVTASDIADFLAQRQIEVDRRRIEIHEPIRTVGEHHVEVELHPTVTVHLRVQVQPEGGVMPGGESATDSGAETVSGGATAMGEEAAAGE